MKLQMEKIIKNRKFANYIISVKADQKNHIKASLPHAFSMCGYFMLLRFQSNYFGWLEPR